jgi:23S rRNA (uracil1939-C5)-methyltransferase
VRLRQLAALALGQGPGKLLELHAGAGNLTVAYREAGWTVTPTDIVKAPGVLTMNAERALRSVEGAFDAIALDPPRTGAPEAIPLIIKRAPKAIVYVSCDPATLARDLEALGPGYRAVDAYPIDLMPQTSHIEVVVRVEAVRSS